MVYLLVATLAVRRPGTAVAGMACGLAATVELFRLRHAPALDAFRPTTAGALLLGRVFSSWKLVAYAVGIGAATGLDRLRGPERKPRFQAPHDARRRFPSKRSASGSEIAS